MAYNLGIYTLECLDSNACVHISILMVDRLLSRDAPTKMRRITHPPMPGVRRLGSPYREPWHPVAHNSVVLSARRFQKWVPSSISPRPVYTRARPPSESEGATDAARRQSIQPGLIARRSGASDSGARGARIRHRGGWRVVCGSPGVRANEVPLG